MEENHQMHESEDEVDGTGQVAQQSKRKERRASKQRKRRKTQRILEAVGANPGGGDSQGVGEPPYGTLEKKNSFQDQDLI